MAEFSRKQAKSERFGCGNWQIWVGSEVVFAEWLASLLSLSSPSILLIEKERGQKTLSAGLYEPATHTHMTYAMIVQVASCGSSRHVAPGAGGARNVGRFTRHLYMLFWRGTLALFMEERRTAAGLCREERSSCGGLSGTECNVARSET